MRFRQERKAALGDEVDAPRWDRFFDRIHRFVELHAEIRVMPSHEGAAELPAEKRQVALQEVERKLLVRHRGIDAERTAVRAPEAADDGDDLDDGCLAERGVDELPPLLHARKRWGLRSRGHADSHGAVPGAILKDRVHRPAVGEPEHVIEVALRILGKAAGVGSSECGDCPPRPEIRAQCVSKV